MKRSVVCEKFLKENEVNCCSVIKDNDEGTFTSNGCECCKTSGCTAYECHGYNPKTKSIVMLGEVCHDCICYFYNGDESEV